jgi:hypothetical protein
VSKMSGMWGSRRCSKVRNPVKNSEFSRRKSCHDGVPVGVYPFSGLWHSIGIDCCFVRAKWRVCFINKDASDFR